MGLSAQLAPGGLSPHPCAMLPSSDCPQQRPTTLDTTLGQSRKSKKAERANASNNLAEPYSCSPHRASSSSNPLPTDKTGVRWHSCRLQKITTAPNGGKERVPKKKQWLGRHLSLRHHRGRFEWKLKSNSTTPLHCATPPKSKIHL
jgi:hypothetical protein